MGGSVELARREGIQEKIIRAPMWTSEKRAGSEEGQASMSESELLPCARLQERAWRGGRLTAWLPAGNLPRFQRGEKNLTFITIKKHFCAASVWE